MSDSTQVASSVGFMRRVVTPRSSGRCWHRTSAGKSSKAFRTVASTSASTTSSAVSSAASFRTLRASSPRALSSLSPAIASSRWEATLGARRQPGEISPPDLLMFGPCKAARSSGCSSAPIPFKLLVHWPDSFGQKRKATGYARAFHESRDTTMASRTSKKATTTTMKKRRALMLGLPSATANAAVVNAPKSRKP